MEQHMDFESSIIFFGAGVSLNSGIPIVKSIYKDGSIIVDGLVDTVLDKICENDDKSIIKNSKLPFEGFIESLMLTSDINPILDIFELGNPNHFHRVAAQLAKSGTVKVFVTTNFDHHLEKAMTDVGMVSGQDFQVISIEPDVKLVASLSKTPVVLYKLHGDIKNRGNLGITLRRVSSKSNYTKMSEFFNFLNSDHPKSNLFFFGYSCSDIFDISPSLEKLGHDQDNTLVVQFIDHTHEISAEDTQTHCISEKAPFHDWQGERSDKYSLDFEIEKTQYSNWKANINFWADQTKALNDLTMGNLFYRISEYHLAEKYFSKYIDSYNTDPAILATAYVHLSNTLSILQNFDCAIDAAEKAKQYAYSCGEIKTIAHAEGALGIAHSNMSNFEQALKALNASLSLESIEENPNNIIIDNSKAVILANIATCYIGIGDRDNYQNSKKTAQRLAEDLGDNDALILCFRNTSKEYELNGEYSEAISTLLEAFELAVKIGSSHFCAITQLDLGKMYRDLGETKKAISASEEAAKHFKLTKNSIGIGLSTGNLGFLFYEEGDIGKARKCFEHAIQVVDDVNKSKYYTALGRIFYEQNDSPQSVNHHLKAIELAGNNPEAQYNTKNSLGQVYLNLGNHDESRKILKDALDVANSLGNRVYIGQSSRWMALALWCLREDESSIKYAKAAYDIFYEIFGESHSKTIQALETLDKVLG
jgi:tetratricopeptide (TPR) repeat protein